MAAPVSRWHSPVPVMRRLMKWTLGLVVTFVLLVALIIALLQITPLRQALLAFGLNAVNQGSTKIEIGDLTGEWPRHLHIVDLSIADTQGPWLTLKEADITWSPLALIRGDISIRTLVASGLTVARMPEDNKAGIEEPETTGSLFGLSPLPFGLKIGSGTVTDITLGRALVTPGAKGQLARLNVDTSLDLAQETLDLSLEIERKDSVTGRLKGSVLYSPRSRALTLSLDLEDGDTTHKGLIDEFADLDLGPLKLTASADTVEGKVTGALALQAGSELKLDGTASGFWSRDLALKLDAKASGHLLEPTLKDIGGANDIALSTDLVWGAKDNLALDNLNVTTGKLSMSAKAYLEKISLAAPHNFEATGTLEGLDKRLELEDGTTLSTLQWAAKSQLDFRTGFADNTELSFIGPSGSASYTGSVSLDFSVFKGAARVDLIDLSVLNEFADMQMSGAASADLSSIDTDDKGNISADVSIVTNGASFSDPTLDQLAGNTSATGKIIIADKGGFELSSLVAKPQAGHYAFNGNVKISNADALSGDIHFTSPALEKVLTTGDASGVFKADATLSGTLNAPRGDLVASLTKGSIGGVQTTEATLTINTAQGSGPLAFRFKGQPGTAQLDALLHFPDEGGVQIDDIKSNLFGSRVTGYVLIDKASLITASLSGERVIFEPLGEIVGTSLAGTGTFVFKASPDKDKQSASLNLTSGRLDVEGVTLDQVVLTSKFTDLFGDAIVDASLTAASGQINLTHLDNVKFIARGPLSKLAIDGTVTGKHEAQFPQDIAITAQTVLHVTKSTSLDLNNVNLTLGKSTASLAKPVTLKLGNGVSAKAMQIDLTGSAGTGHITGDMTIGSAARMKFKLDHVPLDLAALVMPAGRITGSLDGAFVLDTAQGSGKFGFWFKQVRLTPELDRPQPAFDANVDGVWAKGRLDIAAEAHGVSSQPFMLKASLPVTRLQGSAFPALARRGPLSASLNWDGELETLAALADLSGQRVSGNAKVAINAAGDVAKPVVNGSIIVAGGTYENYMTGTTLKNIEARLTGHSSQTLDFTLTATDGGAGRLTGQGTVSLGTEMLQAISISTTLDNMRLVRRSDLDATIDGSLALTGPVFPPTLEAPVTLSGALTTRAMHITIPESLPADVPLVEVIEINGGTQGETSVDGKAVPLPLLLDVTLATAKPVRISGRGLDSLWVGNFAVKGRIDEPLIKGDLNSQRGTLEFAGKTFALSKGHVNFPGTFPVDPTFAATLTFKRDDFTANIGVSGNSAKPKITLTSSPSLPRDEILSRILFDKGVGELSAMETLQLARTLAELSGVSIGGTGGGIMDRIQETLSLDVLRIDSGASGATTVQAGKYIQEGIYVGLEQGALASDSAVKVEIELTPQISVETSIGQNATGDVGVNWKWDY